MKNRSIFAVLLTISIVNAHATTYTLPENPNDAVISQFEDEVPLTRAEQDETLLDVARRFSLGQMEIIRLNPDVDRWNVRRGEIVRLSNKHILPDSPHNGITLNISEYRMYYYPPVQPGFAPQVMSFAHGVGRQDWKTPLGETSVARKIKDPVWHPPESIRLEHAAMGDPLPETVPAGPHNPLGNYAIYLNLPGEYRIHGTDIDKIYGIGMQITHGCVRMYPEDVEQLYNNVSVGTPVYIVKQPIKIGWLNNMLYIEAHPDLEGEEMSYLQRYEMATQLIQKANNGIMPEVNQAALEAALKELTGDPIAIFERIDMPVVETILVNQNLPAVPEPSAPVAQPKPMPYRSETPAAPVKRPDTKIPASPRGYYVPSTI